MVKTRALNLRQELYKLRQLPGAKAWFKEEKDTVTVTAATDLAGFARAVRRADYRRAIRIWRRDRGSYRQEDHLLHGLAGEELSKGFIIWLNAERENASNLYVAALQGYADVLEKEGELETALRLNREALLFDDLNETAHQAVMRLEWRRGNPAAALAQFEACRRILAEKVEVQPVEETKRLAAHIRQAVMEAQAHASKILPA
jgi:DNA-binding SARP family transcriptional activator